MSKRSRVRRAGAAGRRGKPEARAPRLPRCGAPGCSLIADHVVLDPTEQFGALGACECHWPDLVALLWSEGAWLSDCPCPDCSGPGSVGAHQSGSA